MSAYTLDGASSITMHTDTLTFYAPNGIGTMSGWSSVVTTGSMFSLNEPALQVASPCLMAVNYSFTLSENPD